MITVAGGPANGFYGTNLFGAGGFGLSSGGMGNALGGMTQNPAAVQSAYGNEQFIPNQPGPAQIAPQPQPQQAFYSGSALSGPQGSGESVFLPGAFNGGQPTSYAPTYGVMQAGGNAYGTSYNGGTPYNPNLGSPGGYAAGNGPTSQAFWGMATGGNNGGGSPAQAQQIGDLAQALGPTGSITPQYLQEASSFGWTPEMAQDFSLQAQQDAANLPSQNAGEMQGGGLFGAMGNGLQQWFGGGGGGGGPYSLAQIIQSEAGNSPAGQFAVASVLANRANDPSFSQYGGLIGQANAPGQFTGHLISPSGPGDVVSPSQVTASAQEIARALQNGTLGNLGEIGNALYFLAQSSPGGAEMAARGAAPIGGGSAATNNVFSNVLGGSPAAGFQSPLYNSSYAGTPRSFAYAAADPFGQNFGAVPYGEMAAMLGASGFPALPSQASGYGYPAAGNSTLSDQLLGQMGFSGPDYTGQLFNNIGMPGYDIGGGVSQPDTFSSGASDYYTYGNDIGNNPTDYSGVGDYSSSFSQDYSPSDSSDAYSP